MKTIKELLESLDEETRKRVEELKYDSFSLFDEILYDMNVEDYVKPVISNNKRYYLIEKHQLSIKITEYFKEKL